MTIPVAEFKDLTRPAPASTASLIVREPAPTRADSPSCFHALYSALNRGPEKASRAL